MDILSGEQCTVLAGFNEFGFNESSRFNELVLTSKLFLLHKKFGFNEYPGLTNTVFAGFNEFGFNESSRFNELVLTSKLLFYFIKKIGFNEYPGENE